MTQHNSGKSQPSPSGKKSGKDTLASPEEIQEALASLSDEDVAKLLSYARLKASALAFKTPDKGGDDLFQEAIVRMLAGQRQWASNKVNFLSFFFGVIESIASDWKTSADRRPEGNRIWSPRTGASSDSGTSWLESVAGQTASAEVMLIEAEEDSGADNEPLQELLSAFAEDEEVLLLIEGIREGQSKEQLRELGWATDAQFENAHRRLRNRVRKLAKKEDNNHG